MTVQEVMDLFGEDNVRTLVQEKTAQAARKPEYSKTDVNIIKNWLILFAFIGIFALFSTIALELIDKDKR